MRSTPRPRSDTRPSMRVVAIVFPSGERANPSAVIPGSPGITRVGWEIAARIVALERHQADDGRAR